MPHFRLDLSSEARTRPSNNRSPLSTDQHARAEILDLVIGIDAWLGPGASLNRNLEAGILPEAWKTFPNQFTHYFSISSSNSGITCALKSTGVAHSQQASPAQDIAPVILLSEVLLRSGPCLNLEENKFPQDRRGLVDVSRFYTCLEMTWRDSGPWLHSIGCQDLFMGLVA
ncbi:hypothetical protein F2Q69_00013879 [Brassica cretica]|uniref:Uncharacterized protein n=1 Tax=Brassica cretica TaxID=69181 RepID=A0A8S9R196_BRACR|nr:hypothetical protein F2Q69_00013879 [Brassica cretica]